MHLTGVPADSIQHNDIKFFDAGCWTTDRNKLEKCWNRIQDALEHTYTLVSESRQATDLDRNNGILPESDYQLLDAQVIKVENKPQRLILLRNNQTTDEWSYSFSRDCPSWSQN